MREACPCCCNTRSSLSTKDLTLGLPDEQSSVVSFWLAPKPAVVCPGFRRCPHDASAWHRIHLSAPRWREASETPRASQVEIQPLPRDSMRNELLCQDFKMLALKSWPRKGGNALTGRCFAWWIAEVCRRTGIGSGSVHRTLTATKILGVCHCSAPRAADLIEVEAYLIEINTLEMLQKLLLVSFALTWIWW